MAEGHRGSVGGSCAAVCEWSKRAREGGVQALRTWPRSGGPAKLTAEQRVQIPRLLARGAQAYGFRGEVWTARRIAEVIWRTLGVRYYYDHVSRLLRQVGWSRQRPIQHATQRDEQAIHRWHEERWATIKKSQQGRIHHRLGR